MTVPLLTGSPLQDFFDQYGWVVAADDRPVSDPDGSALFDAAAVEQQFSVEWEVPAAP